jgi:hypothetical protein
MKTTITITMEIDGIDPKSDAASTFLDHVESAFDRAADNLQHVAVPGGAALPMCINRYWFAIEGGETRHMPDDQDY